MLGVLCLILSSCAAVVIGAAVGTVAYLEGDLTTHLNSDIYNVVGATNAAADDLRLTPHSRIGDAYKAKMIAYRTDGTKVIVKLTPAGTNVTKVMIRVGTWGEEDYSRRVLRAIESYL